MPKLDKQNRLVIPDIYYDTSGIDFSQDVGIFLMFNQLFLGNFIKENSRYRCLGKVTVDEHKCFVVPKLAREVLNLKAGDNMLCYFNYGKLSYLKTSFIPENR